ncbi:MAG: hypothetical protein AB1750_11805, partial [Chloroflexota bacterium]
DRGNRRQLQEEKDRGRHSMSNDVYEQIFNTLNLRETDDLLDIWQTNDRVEWSDTAFEVIKQIITRRGIELPEQNEPVEEQMPGSNEGVTDEGYEFTDEELKIIDDESPPVFYDALDVLFTIRRIEIAAIASIVISAISVALRFPESKMLADSYLQSYPPFSSLAVPVTVFSLTLSVMMIVITTYFPLKALAYILKLLMEMEFNSRNG